MAIKALSSTVRATWRVSKSERTLLCLRRSLVIFKMQAVMKRTRAVICSSSVMSIVCVLLVVSNVGLRPFRGCD